MFDFINPISYNTDVNPFIFAYTSGVAVGMDPALLNGCGGNVYGNSYSCPIWNYYNFGNSGNSGNLWGNSSGGFSIADYLPQQTISYPTDGNLWAGGFQSSGNFIGPMANIYRLNETSPTQEITSDSNVKNNDSKTQSPKSDKKTKSNKTNSSQRATTNPQLKNQSLKANFVDDAKQYLGANEKDGSYKRFVSKVDDGEWCADFVSYVVNETCRKTGKTLPEKFGNHDVDQLRQWALRNCKFFPTASKYKKGELIAKNIKPGDIMILRENGESHTGFVTKVNSNGTFETIEGNRYDKVAMGRYSPDYAGLSGFIQLS